MADSAGPPDAAATAPRVSHRLVICFDGTWNKVESRTNVSRLLEVVLDRDASGIDQYKFYDDGVGRAAEATTLPARIWDAAKGGLFGDGLVRNVLQAYCWLIEHYGDTAPADGARPEIYIFGFSRGAFTARLLAGLLGKSGLPTRSQALEFAEHRYAPILWLNPLVQAAWNRYKPQGSSGSLSRWRSRAAAGQVADDKTVGRPVPVDFLGIWDTVGRYGVPRLSWEGLLRQVGFGDSKLGRHVLKARHAMAIDEHRPDFNVRPWTGVSPSWVSPQMPDLPPCDIHQRWFAGSHSQVGGGDEIDQLCHLPLQWVAIEAQAAGLALLVAPGSGALRWAPLESDYLAPVIDSHRQFARGLYRWLRNPLLRQIVTLNESSTESGAEHSMRVDVDPSVLRKVLGDPSYRPLNLYHQGRRDLHAEGDTN